jgi:two-component system OmpR family response regulator
VVEDDIVVRTMVAFSLREAGFRATEYTRLRDAEAGISSDPPILVVLDLDLPDGHGLRLMRELQKHNSNVGVIIVSASADLEDKVKGLDLGADDYLTKPFKMEELLARVRSVLRRAPVESPPPRVRFAGWELDRSARILRDPSGLPVGLTSGEYRLLDVLAAHAKQVMGRDQLMILCHGAAKPAFGRAIDISITRLRRKLSEHVPGTSMIQTVRNEGYVLSVDVEVAVGA